MLSVSTIPLHNLCGHEREIFLLLLFSSFQKDVFVLLHVDDFQILGPSKNRIKTLAKALE